MKTIISIIGGIAGAAALNSIHEIYRRFDHDAPRVELVGEEAISKSMSAAGVQPPEGDSLYAVTLVGDLLSNSFYYSLIGAGNKKKIMLRGAGFGLAAGIGALTLTGPLGLSDAPVNRTPRTKVLTVAWYIAGGLIAAGVMKALRK